MKDEVLGIDPVRPLEPKTMESLESKPGIQEPKENLGNQNPGGSEARETQKNIKKSQKTVKLPELKDGFYTEKDRPKLWEYELAANSFSRFYADDKKEEDVKSEQGFDVQGELIQRAPIAEDLSTISINISDIEFREEPRNVQKTLDRYTHSNAVAFTAESRIWSGLGTSKQAAIPRQSFTEDVLSYRCPKGAREQEVTRGQYDGVRAYYRVIVDKDDRYILLACHVNVHGFHRGDLRFVEVNDQTTVLGFEGKSIIGNLLLGDIVVVTELRKTSNKPLVPPSALKVRPDSPCIWAVLTMAVLRRKTENVLFALLPNGQAVTETNEMIRVMKNGGASIRPDKIYHGYIFCPEQIQSTYASIENDTESLRAEKAKFTTYAAASEVIYTFSRDQDQTVMFETGHSAFKDNRWNAADIVELCARFGCSAVNAVNDSRGDQRSFQMMDVEKENRTVRFSIPNSYQEPTENLWMAKNRIEITGEPGEDGKTNHFQCVIETVVADDSKRQLCISARLTGALDESLDFARETLTVSQKKGIKTMELNQGFFKCIFDSSNGKQIMKTLYGGDPLTIEDPVEKFSFFFESTPQIPLNEFQNEYVSMLCSERTPLVIASSPFGCGKSMTMVTAALEMHWKHVAIAKETQSRSRKTQLLITQSNHACVNLVEIMKKCKTGGFIRYISFDNWKQLPETCRTEYDLPFLYKKPMKASLEKEASVQKTNGRKEDERVSDDDIRQYVRNFFKFNQPEIMISTVDSLQGLLADEKRVPKNKERPENVFKHYNVSSVQIDEASQVPEYALLKLFSKFPDATFGLIGDTRQLPPYCEDELKGKLKEYGIGNTMERAVNGKLFPQATLKYVYRCHPVTTQLLSDLFYDGELISGVTADQRNAFMKNRNDFWPNVDYPMIIIDNKEPGYRMGTSCGNKAEVLLVKRIVDDILKPRHPEKHEALDPKDLGVISFYSAQTSAIAVALRDTGVKCGTVDSFQGSEREVMIVCCTNERPTSFMQLSNRLNVALSRARQAMIIIGNVAELRNARYWKTIVERAEQHGCLIDSAKFCAKIQQFDDKKGGKERRETAMRGRRNLKRVRKPGMCEATRRKLARLNDAWENRKSTGN